MVRQAVVDVLYSEHVAEADKTKNDVIRAEAIKDAQLISISVADDDAKKEFSSFISAKPIVGQNEFMNFLEVEKEKYQIISNITKDDRTRLDLKSKKILQELPYLTLITISSQLMEVNAKKDEIINVALKKTEPLKLNNDAQKNQITAKKILNAASSPLCEEYKELYERIQSNLSRQLDEKSQDEVRFDVVTKDDIQQCGNQYTGQYYHEPIITLARINNVGPIDLKPDDEKVEVSEEQRKAKLGEIGKTLAQVKEDFKQTDLSHFSEQNGTSQSAYEQAVKIEKQMLDMEDAIRDPKVTPAQLAQISIHLKTLQTKLHSLKDRAAPDQVPVDGNMFAGGNDTPPPKVNIDDRIKFFSQFLTKIQDFSELVAPAPKSKFEVNIKEKPIEEKAFNLLGEEEKNQYEKREIKSEKKGFLGFGARAAENEFVKRVLDVPEAEAKGTLLSTDGMILNDPKTINDKLQEFNNPTVKGLNCPEAGPEKMAVSIALLQRLREMKSTIDDDKNSDQFQKERIKLVVETTERNIKSGIELLDNMGQRSLFWSKLHGKPPAEDKCVELTNKMRGSEGDVPSDTFVSAPTDCDKGGGDAKEETPYKKSIILKDGANPDIYSIYSNENGKIVAECRGARQFRIKDKDGHDTSDPDYAKAMECAAREVEAIRAKLSPTDRMDPRFGLILTRGSAMTDEHICAIQAYCEFNGYPSVRAVLNGSIKTSFNTAENHQFRQACRAHLEVADNQLNLEQKLGIMLGKTSVPDRIAQKDAAKTIQSTADQTYIASKEMSDSWQIKPAMR